MNEGFITIVCKDCEKPFTVSKKEQRWLEENNLALFKRCSDCRKKRKENKKDGQ